MAKMTSEDLAMYVSELVGTFFLVLTVGFNVLQNQPLAPVSIGFTLMAMIFATGSVSGAHFNPAVTVGVLAAGRDQIKRYRVGAFLAAQVLGGLLASCMYWALLGATFTLEPGAGYSWYDAALAEVLFSFALVFVVLNVATSEEDHSNDYIGLAIGLTVTSAAFAVGPISGCSLNPAVTIAAMLTHSVHEHNFVSLKFLPLYILCPLIGGALAAVVYKYVVRRKEYLPQALKAASDRKRTMEQMINGRRAEERRKALP